MVHILHGYSLADPRAQSMFEDRKTLFVDTLGWDVPVVDDRFEIDIYDGDPATYILSTDEHGRHIGSLRLLPTIGAHLLGDHFSILCDQAPPRGITVREITRLCLAQRLGAAGRLSIRNRLISAMVDHARSIGVTMLTGVVTAAYRKQVMAMGWRSSSLGPARVINGATLGAFRLDIDDDTPARLAANGIYRPGMVAHSASVAA